MSDPFESAIEKTLPLLESIRDGVKPPPRASQEALEELKRVAGAVREEQQSALPSPSASTKAEAPTTKVAPEPPKAEPVLSRAVEPWTFEMLRKAILACEKCPHLVRTRTQVVFGVGKPDADLMFVGEAPGADEDEQGEPFVGKAGQLLTKIIQAMGFGREDVFIANVLKCRPDMPVGESGNRKPRPNEMATCLPWLREQIRLVRPKVLVALGATAVEGLVGTTSPLRDLRGRWLEFEGIPLMVTYHPAYLLRNQSISEKRKVWEDMMLVLERLNIPISEKQRRFFTTSAS